MKLIALAAACLLIFLWKMTSARRIPGFPVLAFDELDPGAPTAVREPVVAVYGYAPQAEGGPMEMFIVLGGKEIPLDPGYKFTLSSARECSTLIPGLGWRGGYVRHTISLSGEGFSGGRPRVDAPGERAIW